jgi:peptidoglycan/LPS O-acetylase OafA/YrhL
LGEALAASLYVSNWYTIVRGVSYFAFFARPGPFDHLWSLAIEEQFYLLWPLVLWGFLRVSRLRRWIAPAATLFLAGVSFYLLSEVLARVY